MNAPGFQAEERVVKCGLPLCFALVFAASCGPAEQQSTPEPVSREIAAPTGRVWRWAGVTGGDPAEVTHPDRYTLEFMEDARLRGKAREIGIYRVWGRATSTAEEEQDQETVAQVSERR